MRTSRPGLQRTKDLPFLSAEVACAAAFVLYPSAVLVLRWAVSRSAHSADAPWLRWLGALHNGALKELAGNARALDRLLCRANLLGSPQAVGSNGSDGGGGRRAEAEQRRVEGQEKRLAARAQELEALLAEQQALARAARRESA